MPMMRAQGHGSPGPLRRLDKTISGDCRAGTPLVGPLGGIQTMVAGTKRMSLSTRLPPTRCAASKPRGTREGRVNISRAAVMLWRPGVGEGAPAWSRRWEGTSSALCWSKALQEPFRVFGPRSHLLFREALVRLLVPSELSYECGQRGICQLAILHTCGSGVAVPARWGRRAAVAQSSLSALASDQRAAAPALGPSVAGVRKPSHRSGSGGALGRDTPSAGAAESRVRPPPPPPIALALALPRSVPPPQVTRADVPGGWGQRIRLRCYALSLQGVVVAEPSDPAGPSQLQLVDPGNDSLKAPQHQRVV